MMLKKVISGGQTGVDRAGLDVAIKAGIQVGGYCPKGRKAEDGIIPNIYPLQELSTTRYQVRTEKNVVESGATLIINKGPLTQGTKQTYEFAIKHERPCLIVRLDSNRIFEPIVVVNWIEKQKLNILNIAGPRESKFSEGIYHEAFSYLEKVFDMLKGDKKLENM
jgi:hypothetical protein